MTFRRKIFISQVALFVVFLILLISFVEGTVSRIMRRSLEANTRELVERMQESKTEADMVRFLKTQELFVFFRVSLQNDRGELIYVAHLQEVFDPEKFVEVSTPFDFRGREYVLKISFPYEQIRELAQNFEGGFLTFGAIILLFFAATAWWMFYRFSRPIHKIIEAIRPYQTGRVDFVPEILLPPSIGESDDFAKLARTLNSLSEKIGKQIQSAIEERNERDAILESLAEGVIAIDEEGKVKYVNTVGSKMLQVLKRHLLGKPFPINSPLLQKCKLLLHACQENVQIVTDSIAVGDTSKIYLDLIAAPIFGQKGAIIVLQDKSSQHRVLEMGKDFIANASHELRTPITIIKGFTETLQDLPEISPEMLSDITEKIVRNCQRMETLVKNLLTLADIENIPKARFQECDIVSLVENCVHVLLTVYPDARVKIDKDREEILVPADPDLLELAIMNLIDNAAKYSRPPAQITITVQQLPDEVKIEISDSGIGIPPENLEHIFERFYTVNKAHSRRLGGAGLGLSIVKTIIEKHDGAITVSSAMGEGTTFTLLLPTTVS